MTDMGQPAREPKAGAHAFRRTTALKRPIADSSHGHGRSSDFKLPATTGCVRHRQTGNRMLRLSGAWS